MRITRMGLGPACWAVTLGHSEAGGKNDKGRGRDQWVAYEYAKVAWLYAQFELADATEIEYSGGGHTIQGQDTFRFLHKHLDWPNRNA
jgi:hypothetical protein